MQANPRAELIVFAYVAGGYIGRLFAARPGLADELFDAGHMARYEAVCTARDEPPLYEQYLCERVHELGMAARVALLPSRTIRKKARRGSRFRTSVPAHPQLFHDHSHLYEPIAHAWFPHPIGGV